MKNIIQSKYYYHDVREFPDAVLMQKDIEQDLPLGATILSYNLKGELIDGKLKYQLVIEWE